MPEDPLTQKERDLRFGPLLDFPRFCQFSNKILEVSVVFDQAVEDEAVDFAGSRILCKNGIKIGGVTNRTLNQLIHLHGWPRADKNDIDHEKNEKKYGRDKENFLDFQKGFPFLKEFKKYYRR
jgi:hypothetical protein